MKVLELKGCSLEFFDRRKELEEHWAEKIANRIDKLVGIVAIGSVNPLGVFSANHWFCIKKMAEKWILLDSLLKSPVSVEHLYSTHILPNHFHAENAFSFVYSCFESHGRSDLVLEKHRVRSIEHKEIFKEEMGPQRYKIEDKSDTEFPEETMKLLSVLKNFLFEHDNNQIMFVMRDIE